MGRCLYSSGLPYPSETPSDTKEQAITSCNKAITSSNKAKQVFEKPIESSLKTTSDSGPTLDKDRFLAALHRLRGKIKQAVVSIQVLQC